ncbi:hypothetical protein FY152_17020 [Agrobacterium tumefaciens]|nr:hypothetical protein FY152_17020 [Agrobacterium tumefaciens]
MPPKEQKNRGTCIFCGKSNNRLSKEHIWPKWLQNHIPDPGPSRHTVSQGFIIDGQIVNVMDKGQLYRPGTIISQRLRVVCLPCNNGWMSRLQNQNKPIIEEFIKGQWPKLDLLRQRDLVRWCLMLATMMDFAHPLTSAIPAEQRLAQSTGVIPEQTIVWIGKIAGEKWRIGFNHFGFDPHTIAFTAKDAENVLKNGLYMAQTTTFVVGSLLAVVYTSTKPRTVAAAHLGNAHSLAIAWPTGTTINEPKRIHNDESANAASQILLPPEQRQIVRPAWVTL